MSSPRQVKKLAKQADLSPEEAIERLQAAGVLAKRGRDLVSQRDLYRAQVALGLSQPAVIREPGRVDSPVGWNRMSLPGGVGRSKGIDGAGVTPISDGPERTKGSKRRSTKSQYDRYDRARLVGKVPKGDIEYLTADIVEKVHYVLVDDFSASGDPIDPPGARDGRTYLESALGRPLTSLRGELKYPTVVMAGAALLHALVHDHPFHNGNKRTGIVALLVFLDKNGYILTADEDELYDYVLRLAAHGTTEGANHDEETQETARWINKFSRKLRAGEKRLRYRDLLIILRSYGCAWEILSGNKLNIERDGMRTQVGYRNEGQEVDQKTLGRIRRQLELDEEHGIDSEVFYYSGDQIPSFINKYRQTLKRLAYT